MNFGAVYPQIGLESGETFYRKLVALNALYNFHVYINSSTIQIFVVNHH